MTTLEALNVEVNNVTLSEKNLIRVGVAITDNWDSSNQNDVEIAKAYCFKAIATQPDWTEDGQSAKYSREHLIKESNRIFKLNGLDDEIIDSIPTIDNSTNIW